MRVCLRVHVWHIYSILFPKVVTQNMHEASNDGRYIANARQRCDNTRQAHEFLFKFVAGLTVRGSEIIIVSTVANPSKFVKRNANLIIIEGQTVKNAEAGNHCYTGGFNSFLAGREVRRAVRM